MDIRKISTLLLFTLIIILGDIEANAQTFNRTYSNGTYFYTTNAPESTLTYYFFDDGYYSFSNDPEHELHINNMGAKAIVYYAHPYEEEDPPAVVFNPSNNPNPNPIPIYHVLSNDIDLITSWNHVEDKDNFYVLRFENTESQTIDGCISLHYNSSDMNIPAGGIMEYNGWVDGKQLGTSELSALGYTNKITWNFENLTPGEQRFVYIPSNCSVPAFSNVQALVMMDSDSNDGCFTNLGLHNYNSGEYKIYNHNTIVSNNPHDPNCINPYTWTMAPGGACQLIKYKIQFQNDGTDPVEDVIIHFSLEHTPKRVLLAGSRHACYLDRLSEKEMRITMNDIFMPGTMQSPPPSHYGETMSEVEVHVWYDLDETTDQCYFSVASIEFDEQAPVIVDNEVCRSLSYGNDYSTETLVEHNRNCADVLTEIPEPPTRQYYPPQSPQITALEDLVSINKPVIFPTISEGYYEIRLPEGENEKTILKVFDSQGSSILEQKIDVRGATRFIDIRKSQKGVYFVQVQNGTNLSTHKIVKM